MTTKTFTLLHGAWHGAWCWDRVASVLRGQGHRVTIPTQTGLGEKADLLSDSITLETFVDDVVSHLVTKDLRDVVLVGHSFGGGPITGAAARVPDRISELVYVDALIPMSGQSPSERLPDGVWAERKAKAIAFSGGISLPCPPAEAFGVQEPELQSWLAERLTPHPTRTYETAITFEGPPGGELPCRYIRPNDPAYEPVADSLAYAEKLGWPIQTIPTGHDAMVTAPDGLADLLLMAK